MAPGICTPLPYAIVSIPKPTYAYQAATSISLLHSGDNSSGSYTKLVYMDIYVPFCKEIKILPNLYEVYRQNTNSYLVSTLIMHSKMQQTEVLSQ